MKTKYMWKRYVIHKTGSRLGIMLQQHQRGWSHVHRHHARKNLLQFELCEQTDKHSLITILCTLPTLTSPEDFVASTCAVDSSVSCVTLFSFCVSMYSCMLTLECDVVNT